MSHSTRPRNRFLLIAGVLTAITLALTARSQLYDTNFYVLWEATAILAGDHPYRELYEVGTPLAAYVSAGAQLLVGYRLIGEFLVQWLSIIAGVVLAFHLGLRLSRSVAACSVTFAVALVILAYTPTYHYSKLIFFPLFVWLAWEYIDRPTPRRGAVFGFTAAVAFLFRHDYGIYAGFASVAALVLARCAVPASRHPSSILKDSAAYAAAVAAVLAPWLFVVQTSEGIAEYVRMRVLMYESPAEGPVYAALFSLNPVDAVMSWIREPASAMAATNGVLWLRQVSLVLPILLVGAAALEAWRHRRRGAPIPGDVWRMALAGMLLAVIASYLFREPAYIAVTAPLTAALGARFLTGAGAVQRSCALVVLLLSGVAAVVWSRESPIFRPSELPRGMSVAVEQLFASPPVTAAGPLDGNPALSLRYLHDCTRDGDRVLVSGSTPYQVNYYARRPPAGGHVYWRQRVRADPEHEGKSLELLQRQSVPFAFSTTGTVLENLASYPRIHEYVAAHYVELEGSGGRLLIDTRRQPTGTFGPLEFPCFR